MFRHHTTTAEESSLFSQPLSDLQWRWSLAFLADRIDRLDQPQLKQAARAISDGIDWLQAPMERYCGLTWPDCTDPCCDAGNVFFRLADLLYLLALGEALPVGQTRQTVAAPCRYLSATGCLLPRRYRPYTCTWFLCEPQMELFAKEPPAFQRRLMQTLVAIRTARLELEAAYTIRFGDDILRQMEEQGFVLAERDGDRKEADDRDPAP